MKLNRVWFVSHYSMPPQYEMRIKTQMYAHYLMEKGIDCTIFSASTIHNTEIDLIEDDSKFIERQYGDLKFVHIKCSKYTGNGVKRVRNMMQFAIRFKKIAANYPLPDVIVADANCVNYGPIYEFCKARGIPILIDMRDLWPMSIVEYYKFSNNNPIIQYLYFREKKMYKYVDGVIFSMEGGKNYISDKGWTELGLDKFYYINNGVKLDEFYQEMSHNVFPDSDLDDESIFKVVYAGSIRTANNLSSIVHAAEMLLDYKNIKILIYGDGDDRISLQNYCSEHNLDNIVFKGQVEKKYIPYILSRCNLSILNYKKAKTLKYGGSQNKLFEYLAAGCPVLLTVDMNYNVVTQNACGVTLDEPSPNKITNAILMFESMSAEDLEEMGKRAKRAAAEYDFKILAEKLLAILEKTRDNQRNSLVTIGKE